MSGKLRDTPTNQNITNKLQGWGGVAQWLPVLTSPGPGFGLQHLYIKEGSQLTIIPAP